MTSLAISKWTFDNKDTDLNFSFAVKLAEKNNWTEDFTTTVISEYLKFLYLCST